MRGIKWLAVLVAIIVTAACFFPWVSVKTQGLTISGFQSDSPHFGKPGIVHVFICVTYILLILIHKKWSVRAAFFLSTINIAWAARNYFLISACRAGICPEKHLALYMIPVCCIVLTILTTLIPVREHVKSNGT